MKSLTKAFLKSFSLNTKILNVLCSLMTLILIIFLTLPTGCAKEPKEIKIGVVLPLSGSAASHGEDIMGGIDIALKEINEKGIKGKKVELIVEDNQSSAQGSVSALRKLFEVNKVPIVIGPVASSDMLAMAPVAESNKKVLISPAASSPKISDTGDYIFRNSLLAEPQGEMMATFCYQTLNKKTVAILFIDDETGRGYKDSFQSRFSNLGGKVLFVDSYDRNGTDFRTQLIKLKASNPEAAYIPSIPKTLGYILRQAKELDIKTVFLANYGVEGDALLEIARDTAEGLYYTSIPIDPSFIKKFEDIKGRKPTIGAPLGYDTLKIVAQAIENEGYTADGIKKGLYKIQNFNGVTGLTSFDEKGDAKKEVIIKIVKQGKFEKF